MRIPRKKKKAAKKALEQVTPLIMQAFDMLLEALYCIAALEWEIEAYKTFCLRSYPVYISPQLLIPEKAESLQSKPMIWWLTNKFPDKTIIPKKERPPIIPFYSSLQGCHNNYIKQ